MIEKLKGVRKLILSVAVQTPTLMGKKPQFGPKSVGVMDPSKVNKPGYQDIRRSVLSAMIPFPQSTADDVTLDLVTAEYMTGPAEDH